MIASRLGQKGTALVIFYFLSLGKDEFLHYALDLSKSTDLDQCYAMAWMFSIGKGFGGEYNKIETFLRENCERNGCGIRKWLKIQSDKARVFTKRNFQNFNYREHDGI